MPKEAEKHKVCKNRTHGYLNETPESGACKYPWVFLYCRGESYRVFGKKYNIL